MKQRFDFGEHVRVTRDIKNDGSVTERKAGELLLPRGATGYIRDVNVLPDKIAYYVDFVEYGYSVGCNEQDLISAEVPWVLSRYLIRDTVTLMAGLSVHGKLVAEAGTTGEVVGVEHDRSGGTHYHVRVRRRTFLVPEALLDGPSDDSRPNLEAFTPTPAIDDLAASSQPRKPGAS